MRKIVNVDGSVKFVADSFYDDSDSDYDEDIDIDGVFEEERVTAKERILADALKHERALRQQQYEAVVQQGQPMKGTTPPIDVFAAKLQVVARPGEDIADLAYDLAIIAERTRIPVVCLFNGTGIEARPGVADRDLIAKYHKDREDHDPIDFL